MKKILGIQTPVLTNTDEFVEEFKKLGEFDGVIVEERGGTSALLIAKRIMEISDKEVYLKIACCDRNRIALHSQLASAAACGVRNVILADGAHPIHTPFPDAKPVFDLDALGLLRMIRGRSPGFDSELSSFSWRIGTTIGGITSADIARAKSFLAAGIDLFFVPTIKGVSILRKLTDTPIILSVAEEEGRDLSELAREAEAAGAYGMSVAAQVCGAEAV